MTNKKIETLLAAYASEINLWDDPFDAPSVPDRSVLEDFLENPDSVEKDLAAQIRSDLNCKRALDRVKFEKYGVFTSKELISEENFHKILESAPSPAAKLVLNEPDNRMFYPSKGGIFYTKSKLLMFKDGQNSYIYTFRPCAVLLLDNGEKKEWDDTVFRCAVVTPECVDKAVEGQDMLLKNGWILHKWLNYPLSLDQIDLTKKVGSIDNIDEIAVTVEKYSSSDEKMIRYGKEEKKLKACAEYLPIIADTKKAIFEMNETFAAKWAKLKDEIKEEIKYMMEFKKPMQIPTFVGSTCTATDTDTSTMIVKKSDGKELVCLTAKLTDPIFLSKETKTDELPTWSFSLKDVSIPEGKNFVLIDEKYENIGYGIICHATDHGAARLVEYFPEKLESDITNANHVRLVVDIS